MAKGDTVELKVGDEFELSFQLSIKLAEMKKRRDAQQLSHIQIEFAPIAPPNPAEGGTIEILARDTDVKGDPNLFQILPITQDDQKFTRLYAVGLITMFLPGLKPQPMSLKVQCRLCDATGKVDPQSQLPRDNELLQLRIKP
jgi:hypothetical protein